MLRKGLNNLLCQGGVILNAGSTNSSLYLARNLVGIVALTFWGFGFCMLFLGPLAYFKVLGYIDSAENIVEMREVVLDPPAPKCECKCKRDPNFNVKDHSVLGPRTVLEMPTRPTSCIGETLSRPTPCYGARTMPMSSLITAPPTPSDTEQPKFMTIQKRNRSRSLFNVLSDDEVFEDDQPRMISSQVVPIRTTPGENTVKFKPGAALM